jgi:hypothetical protein
MNVTFSGNLASYGGGMYNESSNPIVTNVTFSGNSATSDGSGMLNGYSDPVVIRNSLFWGNTDLLIDSPIYMIISNIVVSDSVVQGAMLAAPTSSRLIRSWARWGITAASQRPSRSTSVLRLLIQGMIPSAHPPTSGGSLALKAHIAISALSKDGSTIQLICP